MRPKEKEMIYIQGYKHDHTLHRTWAKALVIESNEERIVCVTNRSWVVESDKRHWMTREPAICFFYPDRWYNVISMIRKDGIHYYCNVASPALYDEEALKYIDYDLDIKIDAAFHCTILDEDEYAEHKEWMHYGDKLEIILPRQLDILMQRIDERQTPFDHEEVNALHAKYLAYSEE